MSNIAIDTDYKCLARRGTTILKREAQWLNPDRASQFPTH